TPSRDSISMGLGPASATLARKASIIANCNAVFWGRSLIPLAPKGDAVPCGDRRSVRPVVWHSRLQHQPGQPSPSHRTCAHQATMNATVRFIVWGTIPIGSLIGGGLGTSIGLRSTLWVGAIVQALAFRVGRILAGGP